MGAAPIAALTVASVVAAEEVTLTQEEADTLQLILKKDRLMKEMIKSQAGIEALGRVLGMTVTGPVQLAVQWNQAAIAGWRRANTALVQIEKQAVCNDIGLQIAGSTPNERFFEQLSKARGCDE
jgi:hypothetical protein